jgi:hypothetical protein
MFGYAKWSDRKMWVVFKALIQAELGRMWRRLLKRPEPPNPYAQFRVPPDQSQPPDGFQD